MKERETMTIDYAPSLGPIPLDAWGDLKAAPEEILEAARKHGLMPCNADGQWVPLDYVVDEGVAGVFLDVPPELNVWAAADTGSGEGDSWWLDGEALAGGEYRLFDERPRRGGIAGMMDGDGWTFRPSALIERERVLDWWTLMEHITSKGDPFVGFHQDGKVYRVQAWMN